MSLTLNADGRWELASGDYFTSGELIEIFFPGSKTWKIGRVEHGPYGYEVIFSGTTGAVILSPTLNARRPKGPVTSHGFNGEEA